MMYRKHVFRTTLEASLDLLHQMEERGLIYIVAEDAYLITLELLRLGKVQAGTRLPSGVSQARAATGITWATGQEQTEGQ